MALSTEEKTKLHSEINQLINHRFIVTTTGITVFGVFAAFLVPKGNEVSDSALTMLYTGTSFIYVFLAMLVYWACSLQNAIRMISSYMVLRKQSEWEVDVEAHFNSSIPHGATYTWNIFYTLGFASFVWPFAIEMAVKSQVIESFSTRHWVVLLFFIAYTLFTTFLVFVHTKLRKDQLLVNWRIILNNRTD